MQVDISAAYTSIKIVKDIASAMLSAKIDSEARQRISDFMEKLGNIQDALFYLREELSRLQEENHGLKNSKKELEDKLSLKERLRYEAPSYWVEIGDKKDGPFCQKCYDVDSKLVRLQVSDNDVRICRGCGGNYYGPNYVPSPPSSDRIPRRRSLFDGY